MAGNMWDEWLRQFLYEYQPAYQGAYTGWAQPYGTTRPRQNWLENMFPTYQNRYMSQVYPQIKAGQTPSQTFEEFLTKQNPQGEFANLPFSERGEKPYVFSPAMRMIFR